MTELDVLQLIKNNLTFTLETAQDIGGTYLHLTVYLDNESIHHDCVKISND